MQYDIGLHAWILNAATVRIVLELSSDDHEGRLVLLTLDRESFAVEKHKTGGRIDDVPIEKSVNSLEVLLATGMELHDTFYTVFHTDEVIHVLIYTPSFSTHIIEIESISVFADIMLQVSIDVIVTATAIVCAPVTMLLRKREEELSRKDVGVFRHPKSEMNDCECKVAFFSILSFILQA